MTKWLSSRCSTETTAFSWQLDWEINTNRVEKWSSPLRQDCSLSLQFSRVSFRFAPAFWYCCWFDVFDVCADGLRQVPWWMMWLKDEMKTNTNHFIFSSVCITFFSPAVTVMTSNNFVGLCILMCMDYFCFRSCRRTVMRFPHWAHPLNAHTAALTICLLVDTRFIIMIFDTFGVRFIEL